MDQALGEYQTELMDPSAFERYWPFISDELDRVRHIWSLWYTKEYLYCGGLSGEFSVWGTGPSTQIRLVVFSRIIVYPAAKVFHVPLAFGNDVENCLPSLIATLESAANANECDRCEIVGRKGWEKLIPGFKSSAIVLNKPLQHFMVQ